MVFTSVFKESIGVLYLTIFVFESSAAQIEVSTYLSLRWYRNSMLNCVSWKYRLSFYVCCTSLFLSCSPFPFKCFLPSALLSA